jgi:hypothetical protein
MMLLRRTLLVTALTLAASAAGTGVAMASAPVTPPTPVNGSNGACNMTNPNAAYGMFTVSQSHANPNGWVNGMNTAINNSTGGNPINCGGPSSPPPRP